MLAKLILKYIDFAVAMIFWKGKQKYRSIIADLELYICYYLAIHHNQTYPHFK